jgi:hypothetical protein
MCDEDNYRMLRQQMRRTECTLPAALRDVLYFACYVLIYQTPHNETIKLLWHPSIEQVKDAKTEPTPLITNKGR